MARPILSRPRTRVYGCNYDKGESYYKPMVDHLDRKYSGRPLFPEPRTSLADEIAASRNDLGSRDLSGPRSNTLNRDLDLEIDPLIRNPQLPSISNDPLFDENEEIVYDSRGQRSRRRLAENFVNDVTATTQHLKAKLAAIGLDEEVDAALTKPLRRLQRQEQDTLDSGLFSARKDVKEMMKSTFEDAEAASYKRRSKIIDDVDLVGEKPMLMKWTKLINEEDTLPSAAATRARQTKARLNDLESEMEELSERQAKRERRAAALRALINETAAENESIQEQSSLLSKKVSIRERSEKHVTF
ncbi:uncharacterized protein LOC116434881 isoform X2 [Nomia melanderi]|uniref:uncharacterized protein LOC116434881 isoform X2 n=1 Tax=Nomia melanderi TaxID=2448451 RepID=UPI0013043683|nr:uncharacterized protein LOC116434881 [Nomia melanderi]XP_031849612.1 uncharacterized protein LOC116434881 [Nomia melanderi]XP_031849622.1 uncharacterized protein LOC116434881 [Nomia melanderi]XP_031849631.1 uncharacterized protein LOC116434881 [Nomia melanderi]